MNKKIIKILSLTVSLCFLIILGNTAFNLEGNDMKTKDLINKLISAEASQLEFNDDVFVGLNDISSLGVNEDSISTTNIISTDESEFVHVLNGADFGLTVNDSADDSLAFASVIAKAKTFLGEKTLIKLPKGKLDFIEGFNEVDRSYAISIKNLENCVILGDETVFCIHGVISGVNVFECENVSIKNISYDYGRTPFSMGEITECGVDYVNIKVGDNYPLTPDMKITDYLEFDKYTKKPRLNGNFMLSSSDIESYKIDGQNIKIIFNSDISKAPLGTLIVVAHYTYGNNGFYIENSKNTYLEDVNVYTTAGMALVGISNENMYINRFNVCLKPNTDRLMTATADGMHFGACRGELTIKNCLIENTHDDACNVKAGHYMTVSNVDRQNNTCVINKINYMHRVLAGDSINYYDDNLNFISSSKILEILEFTGDSYKVKMDTISDSVVDGVLSANSTTAPKLVFENNIIRNKRNRGILLQSVNSIVRNNLFLNVGHGAIGILTEASQFNEAIVPKDIIIENNKLIGCNSMGGGIGGDINVIAYGKNWIAGSENCISNVAIKNNFIANTGKIAISVTSCNNLSIENNLIYNPARNAKTVQNDCAIALSTSRDIAINENYVINEVPSSDYVSLFNDGTIIEEKVELLGNIGLEFVTVTVETLASEVKKLAEGVVIDMNSQNFDDFATIEETIDFIGKTDAYGKEINPKSSDFEINMFKVTYDDSGMYVAFDIFDDENDFEALSRFWMGDGFEMFITPDIESNYEFAIVRQTYDDSTAQIYITPDYLHVEKSRTGTEALASANQFKANCWVTEQGYAGKVFIPFSVCKELGETAKNGGTASVSFVVADMDEGDDRAQISNTQHNVERNKGIPAKMGKIKFI